jgi:hypothetical protein
MITWIPYMEDTGQRAHWIPDTADYLVTEKGKLNTGYCTGKPDTRLTGDRTV